MSEVAVYTRLVATPGKRDDLIAALVPYCQGALREDGTLAYVLHCDGNDADAIWFYTRFSDHEALELHRQHEAELMAQQPEAVQQLLAAPPQEILGTPVAV